ncbi:DUF6702 family protein [Shewanella kaireitica]|uniref:DUF6702 family protein n=1 Tax=Shewanella kaireitica TaxID=212021 RepID=UPI0020104ADF|nr:DUF6702 family protein [Shewanella kaireitica]MCL1096016.1 hypothetical protein [Shewanella kaireitica]
MKLIIAVFIGLISHSVCAHQQKMATTTISFNHRVDNIEVMHKFYLHDAEHAVKDLFDPSADILSSKATQNSFAEYVQTQFAIETNHSKKLPLKFVGLELDGKYIWIYQETAIPNRVTGLSISNGALQELWPAQLNLVNIEGKGELQSLLFNNSDQWLNVSLTE